MTAPVYPLSTGHSNRCLTVEGRAELLLNKEILVVLVHTSIFFRLLFCRYILKVHRQSQDRPLQGRIPGKSVSTAAVFVILVNYPVTKIKL